MKNVVPVRFSLRKLLIATLALGPLAILPAPLWAVPVALPTSASFTVTNGVGNATSTGTAGTNGMATINANDRTVLVWGLGNFTINPNDTWNFVLPSGGAVLNKVGYATDGTLAAVDTATISGTLQSSGRVFVLANGNIVVSAGSQINTTGGVLLSTLTEANDFSFTTSGNLMVTGTSNGSANTGNISIGGGSTTAAVNVISGSLEAWSGNVITVNGVTTAGDLILHDVLASQGINLAATNTGLNVSVGGNLTVVTNNGQVSQGGANLTVGNVTSITTNGNTTNNGSSGIVLGNITNDFKTFMANVSGNATAGGNVTIADKNDVILGTSKVGNVLSVTAPGNITTSGAVTVGGNVTLASGTSGNITYGNGSSAGTLLTASTASGPITISTVGNLTTGTIAAGGGNDISFTSGNVLTISTGTSTTGNVTGTALSISSTATTSSIGAAKVTLNATAGGIVLPAITTANIVATANGGDITQATGTILTTTGNSTFNAGGNNVTLTLANNLGSNKALTLTGYDVSVVSINPVLLGATTATDNLTVDTGTSGGSVTIGTGGGSSATNLTVGNALAINTNAGAVADNSQYSSMNVFGNVTINTANGTAGGASVTLNATSNSVQGGTGLFGALTINAGTGGVITVSEAATMHLETISAGQVILKTKGTGSDILVNGTISAGATASSLSSTGNVTETGSGIITISGSGTMGITTNNSSTLSLGNASNSFGAGLLTITGGSNDTIVTGSNINVAPVVTAGPVTITTKTNGGITLASASNVTNGTFTSNGSGTIALAGGTYGNVSLNSTSTISQSAAITVNGTMTLKNTGTGNAITLDTATNNITGTVVFNGTGTGAATISSGGNLTVSGNTGGALIATAGGSSTGGSGLYANTWNLYLGNLNVKSLTATALNGVGDVSTGGKSGTISQLAGTTEHSEANAVFTTYKNDIVVGNSGTSNGRVDLSTGGANGTAGTGNVTYLEDSGIKLGNISTQGIANITSATGPIVEDTTTGTGATILNVTGGTASVLNLSAANGSISLGSLTTSAATVGSVDAVTMNASGSAALKTTVGNLALGNIAANSLTINLADATAGMANLTQTGPLSIYGTANFTSKGNITLTNSDNNFGPILLTSTVANKNIAISESNTMNLRTVSMVTGTTGNFTATSVNADIISSGFGGVKPGGIVGGAGSGVVTLVATNGNITVGDATTDFPTTGGVVFNAKNVSLSVLGSSDLVLGAASTPSVAGNLTVTSAIGNITNAGNLSVTGQASFSAGTKNITLGSSGNQFGTLKFTGNTVSVSQSNSMAILTGSASGIASTPGTLNLSSGGDISIVNAGGQVSFGGTSFLYATGNITLPKLLSASGVITVSAAGKKDLSALSKAGDLNGNTPVNLGTGAYSAPAP